MPTGNIIKTLRSRHNLTQEELGNLLGVKKSAIQKYESGTIRNLKIDTIRNLCKTFSVPPIVFVLDTTHSEILYEKLEALKETNHLNLSLFEMITTLDTPTLLKICDICLRMQSFNEQGIERVLQYTKDIQQIENYNKE